MPEIKTAQNLDLGGHEPGYEWVAGQTPPNDPSPGKWIVRLSDVWTVLFHAAPTGAEYPIPIPFAPDEEGERAAKNMANKLVDNAWESYRNDPRRRNKAEEVIW
jgi:hypothetical protein